MENKHNSAEPNSAFTMANSVLQRRWRKSGTRVARSWRQWPAIVGSISSGILATVKAMTRVTHATNVIGTRKLAADVNQQTTEQCGTLDVTPSTETAG